ncbi:Fur family transcriptional regulator [Maritimibacter sp. DP1N21-5]|uniref:Fur family transcriptional regulator n=1 Tax=Maritimibacter sp. DP1N21-5 TaxID=2836867 RepID=UPI001C437E83|nr:Fur family transcriptional regulator [Maritimibacter sp. DP1N21-5]MBV7410351.1 transcriptional repressor [Maritimibacter sp. DP1N21-5]
MTSDPMLAFHEHDHAACTVDLLGQAEAACAEAGVKLTPVRRATLEILLADHRAMGAYEVLEKLGKAGFGTQPPVAYRALDFLVEQGLAHRIRRLNAFTACIHPARKHAPVFLICAACDAVAEAGGARVRAALDAAAASIGFEVERANVEALGLCPACREARA